MAIEILGFRDWVFQVDREETEKTYRSVSASRADECLCNPCKNYIACRNSVFPDEIIELFRNLGIDYRKEVELSTYAIFEDGLQYICGWFHFKGLILKKADNKAPSSAASHSNNQTNATDNFLIDFWEGYQVTYFEDKSDLVQVEFEAHIPWVIEEPFETDS